MALAFSGSADAQSVKTISGGNKIVTVNAASPGTITSTVTVTGLDPLTSLAAIDFRPAAPRVLYGISNVGTVYVIDTRTGVATKVGPTANPTIGGIAFDFNPTVDRIRVDTQTRQDFRLNPDTGALAAYDGTLAYAAGDPLAGAIVNVAGAAYTNPVAGATSTTLFVIDTRGALAPAQLATQGNATTSPNTGTLFSVGPTGVTTLGNVGFDIGRDGTALATLTNPTTRVTSLYRINLTTGSATLIGALGGNTLYEGLAISLDPFATMGGTANQTAVGGQLDQFVGIPTAATLGLFNSIDALYATPGAQSAALTALSPAAFSTLGELALNPVEVTENTVLGYTHTLRGNGVMPDGAATTLDPDGRIGAWFAAGDRFGRFDAAADRPEVQFEGPHVLGGLDYRLGGGTAIGVFGGYNLVRPRLSANVVRSELESWFGGAYATAMFGPLFVDAWGSYTDLSFDLKRDVTFGTFAATPFSQTNGDIVAGGGSVGASLNLGGVTLEPFGAVRYAKVQIDGFSESGGSIAALNVSSQEYESLRGHLGARLGGQFASGRMIVRPEIRGGWYHEFMKDPQVFSANFLSPTLGTSAFPFTVSPFERNYYDAGASLNISDGGPVSFAIDYQGQFGDDRRIHSVTAGAHVAF
ncbi:MAG: DUF4394 domain-containing protein [Croceibacterium sp.]